MSLNDDIATLSQINLFKGFGPEQLRLIAFGSDRKDIPAETELFHAGAYADGGYVVVRGEIELVVADGKHRSRFGPGSLIGEMALITETKRPARAVALVDSQVIKIPRALFRRILEEYPELASILHENISRSVQIFVGELERVKQRLDR